MHHQFFKLCILSLFLVTGLRAESEPLNLMEQPIEGIVKRQEIPEVNATILLLKNGMKVALKKTTGDDDVIVRMTALGGYASLPESQWVSGSIVAKASIRSGIGSRHFDQLHQLLFDKSIEFDAEILPFSRDVEGTAAKGEIDTLMKLIHDFFTAHNLTEHSFKTMMQKTKERLAGRSKNSSRIFEDAYSEFNHPKIPALRPFSLEEVDRADYKTGLKLLENAFLDPSEFACVITGSFDTEQLIETIEKHLATIRTPSDHQSRYALPGLPSPDKGIRTKVVKAARSASQCVTILTFQVLEKVSEKNFNVIENCAMLLQRRLKKTLLERYGVNSVIINATTEYPLYPYLSYPSIKIQYFSDQKNVTAMGQTILSELKKMQKEGVTEEEIEVLKRKSRKSAMLHETDNSYWVMVLSNYLSWDWDPLTLLENLKPLSEKEKAILVLKTYFSLNDYTIISSQP